MIWIINVNINHYSEGELRKIIDIYKYSQHFKDKQLKIRLNQ